VVPVEPVDDFVGLVAVGQSGEALQQVLAVRCAGGIENLDDPAGRAALLVLLTIR
jgi:hypothetical protein